MDDEIKALIGEHGEISHITFNCSDGERVPLSDELILLQLPGRVIQDGHLCSSRSQDWALLPSARSQAEDVNTF